MKVEEISWEDVIGRLVKTLRDKFPRKVFLVGKGERWGPLDPDQHYVFTSRFWWLVYKAGFPSRNAITVEHRHIPGCCIFFVLERGKELTSVVKEFTSSEGLKFVNLA